MPTNPVEFAYQPGRTIYFIRSEVAALTITLYNTNTGIYEPFNVSNWSSYAIIIPEVATGYYRIIPPAGSLIRQATEIFYEQQGVSPASTDGQPIGVGSSQGVNVATVDGAPYNPFDPAAAADIVNLALAHLGQSKIVSLSDNTENARKANLIFTNCAKEVLRDAWWNFASTIVLLNLNNDQITNAVPGWNYVYDIPTDCLLVRKVYGETGPIFDVTLPFTPDNFIVPISNPLTVPFRVVYVPALAGKELICNINPVYMEYTSFILDVTLWDADFVKAMTFKLATELAVVLTGSQDKEKRMEQKYLQTLSEAQKLNGNENGVPRRPVNDYLDVRA